MIERLEFRYAREKQVALAVIGIVLVAGGLWMALRSADVVHRWFGWFVVAFFALCTIIAVKRMLMGGTPFVFERAGIAFPTGTFGLLPWAEIESYKIVTIRGNEFLALTFRDPERILSRVSAAKRKWARTNQRLGWGHWALSFTGLAPGMNEAIAFMREHSAVPPG